MAAIMRCSNALLHKSLHSVFLLCSQAIDDTQQRLGFSIGFNFRGKELKLRRQTRELSVKYPCRITRLDEFVIGLELLQQQRRVLLVGNSCTRRVTGRNTARDDSSYEYTPSETFASKCAMLTADCSVASTRFAFA